MPPTLPFLAVAVDLGVLIPRSLQKVEREALSAPLGEREEIQILEVLAGEDKAGILMGCQPVKSGVPTVVMHQTRTTAALAVVEQPREAMQPVSTVVVVVMEEWRQRQGEMAARMVAAGAGEE